MFDLDTLKRLNDEAAERELQKDIRRQIRDAEPVTEADIPAATDPKPEYLN